MQYRQLGPTGLKISALAWCLKNPRVSTVILGASRVGQLQENLGALEVADMLTPEVMIEIDAASASVAE